MAMLLSGKSTLQEWQCYFQEEVFLYPPPPGRGRGVDFSRGEGYLGTVTLFRMHIHEHTHKHICEHLHTHTRTAPLPPNRASKCEDTPAITSSTQVRAQTPRALILHTPHHYSYSHAVTKWSPCVHQASARTHVQGHILYCSVHPAENEHEYKAYIDTFPSRSTGRGNILSSRHLCC
jgi:hypothetical protein